MGSEMCIRDSAEITTCGRLSTFGLTILLVLAMCLASDPLHSPCAYQSRRIGTTASLASAMLWVRQLELFMRSMKYRALLCFVFPKVEWSQFE